VDQRTIERIPVNGRNFTDLMSLQPGRHAVSAPGQRVGGGARPGDERQRQDPRPTSTCSTARCSTTSRTGPAGSAAGTALGMDTVREFRVESNAYSAEFGRNSAGRST
jgi:hypothetical protein